MESLNEGDHHGQPSPERLLQGDYTVDVFGFVKRAWELFWQEPLKFIGFSLLVSIVFQLNKILLIFFNVQSLIGGYQNISIELIRTFMLKMILLIVAAIAFSLLLIPLFFGVLIAAFKKMTEQQVRFIDFLHGYRYWASLIASGITQTVILLIAMVVFAFPLGLFMLVLNQLFPHIHTEVFLMLFFLLLMTIPSLYFSVSYFFSPLLIIDRRPGFWKAMEMSRKVVAKRWFSVFLLFIATNLLSLLINLPINIVFIILHKMFASLTLPSDFFVLIPLYPLTLAVAYKEIFGLQSSDW